MNTSPTTTPAPDQPKKPYQAATLIPLGDLRVLTQAGTSKNNEGTNSGRKNKP